VIRSAVTHARGVVPSWAWKRRCNVAGLTLAWDARTAGGEGGVEAFLRPGQQRRQ